MLVANCHTTFNLPLLLTYARYRDSVHIAVERLLANLNALVAVSKGMQAVKLCTNSILQFLTGGAS